MMQNRFHWHDAYFTRLAGISLRAVAVHERKGREFRRHPKAHLEYLRRQEIAINEVNALIREPWIDAYLKAVQ